ncbi:MAG TPA: response regulator, partial [Dyadobacter sp.]|nr:response regulator [Dyadobacter sp.]
MSTRINVLIVENDILLANNMKLSLQKEGLFVAGTANSMETALHIMKKNDIDIALIDIELDGPEDGVVTATELVKIKWIPIIYITGNTPLVIGDRIKKTFPAAFLEKPVRVKELHVQIEIALHNFNAGNLPNPVKIETGQIFLPTVQGLISVKVNEILYIRAERVNAQLFLTTTESQRIQQPGSSTMLAFVNKGRISTRLPSHFFELSRSFVVNLNHV